MHLHRLQKILTTGALLTGLAQVTFAKTTREFNYQLSFTKKSDHAFSLTEFRQVAINACQEHIESLTDEDPLGIYGDYGVSSVTLDQQTLSGTPSPKPAEVINQGTAICGFWLDIHPANARE